MIKKTKGLKFPDEYLTRFFLKDGIARETYHAMDDAKMYHGEEKIPEKKSARC